MNTITKKGKKTKTGVVYSETDVVILDAKINSLGKGDSEGVLLFNNDGVVYLANTAKDTEETLDLVKDLITELISSFSKPAVQGSPLDASFTATGNNLITKLTELKNRLK